MLNGQFPSQPSGHFKQNNVAREVEGRLICSTCTIWNYNRHLWNCDSVNWTDNYTCRTWTSSLSIRFTANCLGAKSPVTLGWELVFPPVDACCWDVSGDTLVMGRKGNGTVFLCSGDNRCVWDTRGSATGWTPPGGVIVRCCAHSSEQYSWKLGSGRSWQPVVWLTGRKVMCL